MVLLILNGCNAILQADSLNGEGEMGEQKEKKQQSKKSIGER